MGDVPALAGRGIRVWVVAIIILIFITTFSIGIYLTSRQGIDKDEKAPDFILKDLDGMELRLSDLRGGPVLMSFINDRCSYSYSRDQMREMKNVSLVLGEQNLTMLTINARIVEEEQFRTFRDRNGCNWTFAVGTHEVISAYGADAEKALPMVLLIDGDGIVRFSTQGSVTRATEIISAFNTMEGIR